MSEKEKQTPEEEVLLEGEVQEKAPEEIPDEAVPLAELPDEEVPLANVPKTGDISVLWYVTSLLAACGLAVFRELGLIETRTVREAGREALWVCQSAADALTALFVIFFLVFSRLS